MQIKQTVNLSRILFPFKAKLKYVCYCCVCKMGWFSNNQDFTLFIIPYIHNINAFMWRYEQTYTAAFHYQYDSRYMAISQLRVKYPPFLQSVLYPTCRWSVITSIAGNRSAYLIFHHAICSLITKYFELIILLYILWNREQVGGFWVYTYDSDS